MKKITRVTTLKQLKVGDRVKWSCELERYPFFLVGPGEGTVVRDGSDAMNTILYVQPDSEELREVIREGWGGEVAAEEPIASSVAFHEDFDLNGLEGEELWKLE